MLDSEGFVAAGWVHDLGLHCFQTDSQKKYLVRAKLISKYVQIISYHFITGQSFRSYKLVEELKYLKLHIES